MATIKEYISKLPAHEKKISLKIHSVICGMLSGVTEKFTYGVPHYFGNSRICFIWPSSVSGGKLERGIAFGFCKGYLMDNDEGLLTPLENTNISMIHYTSVKDINEPALRALLAEAIMLDERTALTEHLKKPNRSSRK